MKKFTLRFFVVLILGAVGALSVPDVYAKPGSGKILEQKVSGKVTDAEKGETLPGVSIIIKGTQKGTTTDANGDYSLVVADSKAVLVFSIVGYEPREITVGNQSTINLGMKTDTKALGEVIVVGYGVQKKATVSGSVVSVKGTDLIKSPTVNLSNSIAGRMAGVVAVNRSGEPGLTVHLFVFGVQIL